MAIQMKPSKPSFYSYWLVLVLSCIGFAINLLTYYPGFLSSDSLAQYDQALTGQYDTWHPTIMAFTWHVLNFIHQGPQPMLALQLFFLWGSYYYIATSLSNRLWHIALFLLFFFAPFIQNFAGWVVKDTMMAFSWLFACAIMFRYILCNQKGNLAIALITALLLLYGSWMRYNAIVALPPLAICWAWMVFRKQKVAIKLLCSAGLVAAIFWGQGFFDNVILKANKSHTEIQIYFHDIAGVFVKYNKNYFPEVLINNPAFDTAYIRSHYNPVDVTALLWNPDNKNFLLTGNYDIVEELKNSWLTLLKSDPVLYFKHRLHIYEYFLTLKKEGSIQYYFSWIEANKYGFHLDEHNSLLITYSEALMGQEERIYFQVWFWVLLNVLLFPLMFFIRNRTHRLYYFCVAAAGFLYTLPQFMVANTVRDFRYIYWSCFACIIALLVLFASKMITKKQNLQ